MKKMSCYILVIVSYIVLFPILQEISEMICGKLEVIKGNDAEKVMIINNRIADLQSKLEPQQEQLDIPVVIQRDIYQELRFIGLTHDQCSDVMDLIDTLPIHIKDGINNTKVSVSNGIITVEPNHVV